MAKLLAKGLFGSEKNIKRFDMSEYSEHFTVSRLLGSPPGFVGYNEGGELVNAIKDNPYCILLFDEVEKAHPDIYDIFLQMMDDGRITDKLNRTVSLENCIIIMTSNIGSYEITKNNFGFITKNVDDKKNDVQQTIKSSLRKFFRPEFINRIGSTIIFNPLNRDDLSKIFELQIKEVRDNVKRLYNSTIIIDDSAKNQILNIVCEEKNNNARPMRKYIRDNIEDLLTDEVINNNGKLKNDLIIKYNDKFIINYKENKNVKIKRKDIKNNIQKCQNK